MQPGGGGASTVIRNMHSQCLRLLQAAGAIAAEAVWILLERH